jgi:hypothetical protein
VAIILRIIVTTNLRFDIYKECQYMPDEEMTIYLHAVTFYFNILL